MKSIFYSSMVCVLTAGMFSLASAAEIKTGETTPYQSTEQNYTIEEGGALTFSQTQNTTFNQTFTFAGASAAIPTAIGEDIAVIGWSNSENSASRTVSFTNATFAGSANVRVAIKSTRDTTVNLQGISGQSFSGSVSVTNGWNGGVTVQYRGTGLSAAQYIFGTAAKAYDTSVAKYGCTSGTNFSALSITGDASLAGIAGSTNLTGKERLTTSGTNLVLTLTGADSYIYGGAMGTAAAYLNLAMTGGGTQSFTGTTYLGDILLSGGSSLILAQNATINGNITIDLTGLTEGTYNFITGKDIALSESNLTGLGTNMRATIEGGTVTLQMVPELASATLGLMGLAGLALYRRRRI